MTHHVAIGIVGGVGPEAGCLLHQYIIEETHHQLHTQKDQDHFESFHLALPGLISDRSEFLLHHHEINPAVGVYQVLELLEDLGRLRDEQVITGIPCNTFHAIPVMTELSRLIHHKQLPHVELLNMIEETCYCIRANYPAVKKVGLLSTTGTRDSRIYHDHLEPQNYHIIEVSQSNQEDVHETIYNPQWGIKASSPTSQRAQDNMKRFATQLINQGAEIIILGCTEIPLALSERYFAHVPLLDPMRVLAHSLVRTAITRESGIIH